MQPDEPHHAGQARVLANVILPGTRCITAILTILLIAGAATAQPDPGPWKIPSFKARKKNPVEPTSASIQQGKSLYLQNCLVCHGQAGEGDGPGAAALKPPPGNLAKPSMWLQSDGELFVKITEGRPPMPMFGPMLTDEQKWHIINYVRTLAPAPAAPQHPVPAAHRKALADVLEPYLEVGEALAKSRSAMVLSKMKAMATAAAGLRNVDSEMLDRRTRGLWESATQAVQLAVNGLSDSLEKGHSKQAAQAYADLSRILASAVEAFGHGLSNPPVLAMWRSEGQIGGKEAVWLQNDGAEPRNPYGQQDGGRLLRLFAAKRASSPSGVSYSGRRGSVVGTKPSGE